MAPYAPYLWFSLVLVLPLYLIFKNKKQNKKLPPSPSGLPIIGNLHQLGQLLHQSYWKLSKKYGPIMLLRFGRIPVVVVSSAEAARDVLKIHDLACCSRPSLAGAARLSYNFLDVALAPYGDHWRYMRKLIISELFSLKRVQSSQFVREEEFELLVNSISSSATESTPIDLTDKLFALTANITYRMSFGIDYQGTSFDRDRFHEVVQEAMAVAGIFSKAELFPFAGWIVDWITGHHTRTERVFHELDSFFEYAINDHLKPGRGEKDHNDIIDVLLRVKEEKAQLGSTTDDYFTKNNIKGVLLDLFLAGVDTVAITLNWAMAELVKNPRVLEKVQAEIRNHVGNKGKVSESDSDKLDYLKMIIKETLRIHPPAPVLVPRETISHCKIDGYDVDPKTMILEIRKHKPKLETTLERKKVSESDTDKLDYLKMIIKETFRIHPPAPVLLPRETISPCKINGYDVDPKTMIQVNVWAIGRDPKYWKEPEKFYPERFSDSSIDYKGQNFELLPFGAGRRICVAMHLGTVTIEYVLANLLYLFDWKLPEGMKKEDMDMEEKPGVRLTITKNTPLILVPVKHLQ